ncbi:unnamed protein product [Discula destructiva]
MGKSELKAEKKASKRKLSEVANDVDDSAAPSKKAKKEKKSDKKEKNDKYGNKKSRKDIKAGQADDLNHAEYDVEDKAIEETERTLLKVDTEDNKSKKAKKDKKIKKKSKVKAEELQLVKGNDITDSSGGKTEELKIEVEQTNGHRVRSSKKGKKEKKEKKSKEANAEPKANQEPEINGDVAELAVADKQQKPSKKDKQSKKSKKDKSANGIEIKDNDNKLYGAVAAAAAEANGEANGEGMSSKNNRFICFIGNLPFTATKADIEAHFASLAPISVRLLTEKAEPTKSRGIAFIEFDHFSRMKTCLAKFHHTEFTDAAGNMRKINVELTAGGGGKTAGRMDKVKERNFKLNEERTRRIAKEEQEKEDARQNGGKKPAEVKRPVTEDPREDAYVHPSRRAHVPGRKF